MKWPLAALLGSTVFIQGCFFDARREVKVKYSNDSLTEIEVTVHGGIPYRYVSYSRDLDNASTSFRDMLFIGKDGSLNDIFIYDTNMDNVPDKVYNYNLGRKYQRNSPRTEKLFERVDELWKKYRTELNVEQTIEEALEQKPRPESILE